jgi:hypothetical protein
MLFQKPGWLPESLGGTIQAKPVSQEAFLKYDVQVSPFINYYVLVQFVLLIGATFLFLSAAADNPGLNTQNILLTVWIIWTTGSLGGILERRRWAWWSELLRLGAVAAAGITFLML